MITEPTTLSEVKCFECARPISAIPAWLATAKVKFQCEECRQKHPRVPGMSDVDLRRSALEHEDVADVNDVPPVVEEDDENEDEGGDDVDEDQDGE